MRFLPELSGTAADQLAVDEWLFRTAELEQLEDDVLRWWEPTCPAIVLGRGSRIHQEVDVERCREEQIEIVRRTSGGATVAAGPGCLMYSLILHVSAPDARRSIPATHCWVLTQLARAIRDQGYPAHSLAPVTLRLKLPVV